MYLMRLPHGLVHRQVEDAWHRAPFLPHPCSRTHEHRIDKILRREPGLAHHGADRFALAQPSKPCDGECHAPILAKRTGPARAEKAHFPAIPEITRACDQDHCKLELHRPRGDRCPGSPARAVFACWGAGALACPAGQSTAAVSSASTY